MTHWELHIPERFGLTGASTYPYFWANDNGCTCFECRTYSCCSLTSVALPGKISGNCIYQKKLRGPKNNICTAVKLCRRVSTFTYIFVWVCYYPPAATVCRNLGLSEKQAKRRDVNYLLNTKQPMVKGNPWLKLHNTGVTTEEKWHGSSPSGQFFLGEAFSFSPLLVSPRRDFAPNGLERPPLPGPWKRRRIPLPYPSD